MKNKVFLFTYLLGLFINVSCDLDPRSRANKNESKAAVTTDVCCVYNHFSLDVDSTWGEYISSDTLVVFAKKHSEPTKYRANFSGMLLKEDEKVSTVNIDAVLQQNIANLKDVYAKMLSIGYDTIPVDNGEGRKFSFVARTYEGEDLGSIIYLYKKQRKLFLFSFQGPNEDGSFREMASEVSEINKSIKFK